MANPKGFNISVDKADVKRIYEDLAYVKNGAPLAMSRAINHTIGVVRTEAASKIAGKGGLYAYKVSYVKEKLEPDKANVNKLTGSIKTPWRGTLLTRFPHRDLQKGISVKVMKSGGTKKMPGAFFINLSGKKNPDTGAVEAIKAIAYRPSDPSKVNWQRTGLRIGYGPSPSQAFKKVQPEMTSTGGNRLMQRLQHEADRLLAKQ